MKIPFKKFILFFSALFMGLVYSLWACGPSLYLDEDRFALFRSTIDGQSGLEPFYYSERFLNSNIPDPDNLDYKRNCEEWRIFTNNEAIEKDIYEIQYQTTPNDFEYAYNTGNWKEFSGNTFIKWLTKKQNKKALDYMMLSKQSEFTQFGNMDPWNDSNNVYDNTLKYVAVEASRQMRSTSSSFLRERYAFQAEKAFYYLTKDEALKGTDSVAMLYQKYLCKSNSVILGWSQLYYAMILDSTQRTTYLLKTFDNSEEKKLFCYHQISATDLDTLEQRTSDKHLLALIYTMRVINDPGRDLNAIQKVYSLEPESKYLPFLISREINKLENWLWSPEMLHFNAKADNDYYGQHYPYQKPYSYFAEKNLVKDKAYLKTFCSFLEQMNSNKVGKNYLNIALAHLYNMSENYSLALQKINQIKNIRDTLYATQKLIEYTIALSNIYDIRKDSIKNILYKNIQSLIAINPVFVNEKYDDYESGNFAYDDDNPEAERNDDLSELLLLLSRQYQNKSDIVTAGLLYNKAGVITNANDGSGNWNYYYDENNPDTSNDNYTSIAYFDRTANPATIDSLLSLKHKKNKSNFEKYITTQNWASDDFYKDLKGTILLRQQKFAEALKVFKEMNANFWEKTYAYKDFLPKTSVTNLASLTPWIKDYQPDYPLVSKRYITQDIVNLLEQIKNEKDNEKKSQLYCLLGNAEYNMSYIGFHWMMTSYGWSSGISLKPDWFNNGFCSKNEDYMKNYYGCAQAISQYKNALALTKKPEQKASILLMLSLCDKAMQKYNDVKYDIDHDYNYKYISPYLLILKKQYGNTETYKLALTDCPDIKGSLKNK
ncbi:hypothetical protein A9P82_03740 [Arachidicoccus ginsenosidimutans]|uniref:hypothetical protein n=1 Tax=Arachidicoccus sp. BS20 TaxID=1850526 RepID=UPI0007F142CC|nr:hypothetical protein [Arachidicoccus sp. BS20]ANI88486.1 hypothetical protein A9P82_03740 [Arachidicoccus sp. BS20]